MNDRHPSEEQIALFSHGDLGWWEHIQVRGHLLQCRECQREIDSFRDASSRLSASLSELPAGLNWSRMSAEMVANISLGLEAGEIVGPVRESTQRKIEWRPIAALAVAGVAFAAAWWLNPPARIQPGSGLHHVQLRTTASGIELTDNGHALTLRHASAHQQRPMILSTPGSLRSRYVDDFGQVTINNVYSE